MHEVTHHSHEHGAFEEGEHRDDWLHEFEGEENEEPQTGAERQDGDVLAANEAEE